ncbi:hypothetical protein [Embleya sp. NBC_00896]|uniref:hypothetical protein n=1 Tax=Embleya sp. NBC_00896 TaxID=2975961 RepID=UPI0038693460|nr:hypothetical protein OG928_11210 [Embleya sp. NBC_00896]
MDGAFDVALNELERFMDEFEAGAIEAIAIASAIRRAAAELTAAQNKARDAHQRAQRRFLVSPAIERPRDTSCRGAHLVPLSRPISGDSGPAIRNRPGSTGGGDQVMSGLP